jgi:patatin-like phospholipase/acyl hydrolase
MKKKFHILSIDGGGLKGLIAIRILKIIENIIGKRVTEIADLLAGTSTGGLIISALTVKNEKNKPLYDLDHIANLYLQAGQKVFQEDGLKLSGKETDHFNELLQKIFGEKQIGETLLPIFVPTFDLNENKIVIFKTRSAIQEQSKNVKLIDVCRATSAIPPVFPTYPLQYHNRELMCVDSGYHLKNPSIAVLAEAWKHKDYYHNPDLTEDEIILLSISTGSFSETGKDWSTDIHEVLPNQTIARNYIHEQGLNINLKKINYMRVDLNLGNGSFDMTKLIQIGDRLLNLSKDKKFQAEITELFGKK